LVKNPAPTPGGTGARLLRVSFISVVPSPYQRDLFKAINQLDGVTLRVNYLEPSAPDSPWRDADLEEWETVIPGWCLGKGRVRSHFNWKIPDLNDQDVVVVNAALTDLTTQTLLRRRRKFAPAAKWLFWGELIRTGGGLAGKVRKFLAQPLNKIDGIVAIGSVAKTNYQQRFPKQRIFNLPYRCDIQDFVDASVEAETANRDGAVRFLFCGQMIHRKGVDVLLKSFDRLIQNGSDVQLTLVGREASLPTFLSEISAQAKERIDFRGFQDVAKLPGIFAESDVFVLPSRHDGWGVVINQAIAAGLPVIASDRVGAAHDLVEDNVNGFVVPSMSQLTDREQLLSMRRASIAMRGDLSPASGADQWNDIFREILK